MLLLCCFFYFGQQFTHKWPHGNLDPIIIIIKYHPPMIFITQIGEMQACSKYSTSALVIENNFKAGAVVTHCYMAHRYKEHHRCYELTLSQFSLNAILSLCLASINAPLRRPHHVFLFIYDKKDMVPHYICKITCCTTTTQKFIDIERGGHILPKLL